MTNQKIIIILYRYLAIPILYFRATCESAQTLQTIIYLMPNTIQDPGLDLFQSVEVRDHLLRLPITQTDISTSQVAVVFVCQITLCLAAVLN